jgi:hypothetical protein
MQLVGKLWRQSFGDNAYFSPKDESVLSDASVAMSVVSLNSFLFLNDVNKLVFYSTLFYNSILFPLVRIL